MWPTMAIEYRATVAIVLLPRWQKRQDVAWIPYIMLGSNIYTVLDRNVSLMSSYGMLQHLSEMFLIWVSTIILRTICVGF